MIVDEGRFKECVVKALRIPSNQYRPDLSIGDLEQWDSVAHLDLVSELERQFGVRFNLDEMTELTSLPRLLARLQAAT